MPPPRPSGGIPDQGHQRNWRDTCQAAVYPLRLPTLRRAMEMPGGAIQV
jgi:hypothetical protein